MSIRHALNLLAAIADTIKFSNFMGSFIFIGMVQSSAASKVIENFLKVVFVMGEPKRWARNDSSSLNFRSLNEAQ